MAQSEALDGVLGVAFAASAGDALGLFDLTDIQVINMNLSDPLVSLAGVDIPLNAAVSVAVLVAVWALNDPTWDRLNQEEQILVGVTALLVIGGIFVDLSSIGGTSGWVALGLLGVEQGGYYTIATKN